MTHMLSGLAGGKVVVALEVRVFMLSSAAVIEAIVW